VLDRKGIHQRQLGSAGIAEHHLDTLLLQELEEGALSGHDGQDGLQGFAMEPVGWLPSRH
jgi:hypothetical protein